MIDRYSRKELRNIWSEENKYKIWLEISLLQQRQWKNIINNKGYLQLKKMILKVKHTI